MANVSASGLSRARQVLLPGPGAALRGSTEVMRGSWTRVRGLLTRLSRSHIPDPLVAAETNEAVRFQVAMEVAGRTEANMPEVLSNLGRRFEMLAVLAMFSLVWIFVAPAIGMGGQSGFVFLDLLLPLGFCAWISAEAFSAAVSLHRAQERRMVSVREFLQTPSAWWGGPPSRGASLCLAALAAGLGLSGLLPYEAFAQAVGGAATAVTVTPSAAIASMMTNGGVEDLSLQWLRRIFPGMASLACAGGAPCPNSDADILAVMMGSFNAALFGFGSGMLAFQTIVGMVQTAHEGKVMGQRWHTIWAPIRVAGGVAMLAPIKGYCGIQYVMLMLIVLGYNLANSVWVSYVNQVFSGSMSPGAVIGSQAAGVSLVNGVIASETCSAILRLHAVGLRGIESARPPPPTTPPAARPGWFTELLTMRPTGSVQPFGPGRTGLSAPQPPTDGVRDSSTGTQTWDWGATCGRISIESPSAPLVALGTAREGAQQRSITELAVEQANTSYINFLATRDRALRILISKVRDANIHGYIAATVIPNISPTGVIGNGLVSAAEIEAEVIRRYAELVTDGQAFDTAYNDASRAMVQAINRQGSSQFIARATQLGWASAGAMNATMMRATARASELNASGIPSVRGPDPSQLFGMMNNTTPSELQQRLSVAMDLARRTIGNLAPGVNSESLPAPQVQIGADMQSRNLIARIFKPLSESITRYATDNIGYIDPQRPMSSIQAMGNNMLLTGQAMSIGWIGLNMASEGVSSSWAGLFGAGAAKGAVAGIASLYVPVMIGLLICGALHAYILPMIAFLIWFYAIISVVSVAVELIIAAPVAAFMHIRADGDELINGQQQTVYVMAFNALLRPSLLLFGLATANLVFSAMCNFLNQTYGMAVSTTNGDSVVGIVGWMTMTVMVFYLHYQLVLRCMHLITAVPSTVAELIGARDQSRDEQENTRQVFAAVANISTRAGANLQQGIGTSARGKAEEGKKTAESTAGGGGGGGGGDTKGGNV